MSDFATESLLPLERATLGSVIAYPDHAGPRFLSHFDPDQFTGPMLPLAHLLSSMLHEGLVVSVAMVLEEVRQRNLLHQITPTTVADARAMAPDRLFVFATMDALSGQHLARGVYQVGARLQQATTEMAAGDALLLAERELGRLRHMEQGRLPIEPTLLADVLAEPDPGPVACHIPGLLPEGAALMVTASEGAGKSTMLRQLALAAALGIDPLRPGRAARYEPKRVLIVDAEVSRAQLSRSLRQVWSYGSRFVRDPDPSLVAVESVPAGIDLSGGTDRATLLRLVREHRPDIIAIGPLYRITGSDLMTEEGMRVWQRPFEPLKADGVSVVMEHHAGNEQPGHARMLRPLGSSAVRRWFSQGIGMRLLTCEEHGTIQCCASWQREVKVENWRASRDEVEWPHRLRAVDGSVWWEEAIGRPVGEQVDQQEWYR
jgi:replicative DNA helicase